MIDVQPEAHIAPLSHRGVIRVSGSDAAPFLQGLISNDIRKTTGNTGIYAALLTPQGKFLHDLFILADEADGYLLDCEAARAEDLLHRLVAYRLRAKVTFEDLRTAWTVWAGWGGAMPDAQRAFVDPRLPALGWRMMIPKGEEPTPTASLGDYDTMRLALGVADGSREMEIEKSTLAEGNFDWLNGIDWKKGCYVGQELTARMHYRGLAKRRLFPVKIDGQAIDTRVITCNGLDIGLLRSQIGDRGLALLSVEQMKGQELTGLTCGGARLTAFRPDWWPVESD